MASPLPEPTPAATRSTRTALLGAVVGMAALAGTIVGVGAVAGAHDDPDAGDTSEFFDDDFEAWRPYEECVDGQIGDLAPEADDAAWDTAWDAADTACRDLLPEDVRAEMAAWDAFDECLDAAGVFDAGFEGASAVHIETPEGFQLVEFGETEGSVTISGTDGDLTVTTTGGATILDEDALDARWAEFDDAHAACEELLPADMFDEFPDEGDLDD